MTRPLALLLAASLLMGCSESNPKRCLVLGKNADGTVFPVLGTGECSTNGDTLFVKVEMICDTLR